MIPRVIESTIPDDEPTAWTLEELAPGCWIYRYLPLVRAPSEQPTVAVSPEGRALGAAPANMLAGCSDGAERTR